MTSISDRAPGVGSQHARQAKYQGKQGYANEPPEEGWLRSKQTKHLCDTQTSKGGVLEKEPNGKSFYDSL